MLKLAARTPVPVAFEPEGFFVFESRHARDFVMQETAHPYWKVLLGGAGKGRIWLGQRAEPVGAGDVALLPPGTPHRWADAETGPLILYGLCVRAEVVARVDGAAGGLGKPMVFRQPAWGGEVRGSLRRLLAESGREGAGRGALATGHLWQILGLVWRGAAARAGAGRRAAAGEAQAGDSPARARVESCRRQLEWDFHEEWTLDAAAARAGLGRRRFSTLFREVAGMSWLQALREQRMAHAQHLLRETDRSVSAIAFECGCLDLSHFYRLFRAANDGVAPEAWRRADKSA